MKIESWLVAWIGDADLTAADCHPKRKRKAGDNGTGPIYSALQLLDRFDRLYLLSNDPERNSHLYCQWLADRSGYKADKIQLHEISLSSPTAYAEIYREVSDNLKAAGLPRDEVKLTFHLSPGTPAMTSIWILLAKTRFPARLIQTAPEGGVEDVDFFTNLTDDFLPEFMRRSSARIAKLNDLTRTVDPAFSKIVHQSPEVRTQIELARKYAAFEVSVLILGETGTGKERFAKAIHAASPRNAGPYKTVNCGAISPELANSELFGHKRGAFTDAKKDHKGLFREANGGTLFLDEVGDLPLDTQVRLLRALQEGEITPVGSSDPEKVDVRIVAATHRDLEADVESGRFREDLLHRLAGGIIRLPPLRERGDDSKLLASMFLQEINAEGRGKPESVEKKLSQSAINFISRHDWPGNIRELHYTLVRAHVWSNSEEITDADIRASILQVRREKSDILGRSVGDGFSLDSLLDEVSRHYIRKALTKSGGNKTAAAKSLGLKFHQTLKNRMDQLKMNSNETSD
jgi:DNA-binding NtrC family response regulator